MAGLSRFWQVRAVEGPTVESAWGRITPEARSVRIRLPFVRLAWSRPVAVRIERDGHVQRQPIPDVTRSAQVGLLIASVVAAQLLLLIFRRRRVP
jgi:hypothetical protein